MLEGLKIKLVERKLAQQLTENRVVRACKLSDAKKIGILYDATEESQFNAVRKLLANLQENASYIKALGFADSKELADFHIQPLEFSFFCRKDLNWYGLPTEEAVGEFADTNFDILLCMNLEEKNPLTYITARSKASFKVGLYSPQNAKYLDVMLSLDEESRNIEELAKQILHYLDNIRYE